MLSDVWIKDAIHTLKNDQVIERLYRKNRMLQRWSFKMRRTPIVRDEIAQITEIYYYAKVIVHHEYIWVTGENENRAAIVCVSLTLASGKSMLCNVLWVTNISVRFYMLVLICHGNLCFMYAMVFPGLLGINSTVNNS